MEGSDGSPPSSLWMIHAAELFPKPPMEKEDDQLAVPFQELAGESVKYLGRTDDGVLALSNYRLFLLKNSTFSETSVPLGLIETAQIRDLFHLLIFCKDASTVKCSSETAEQCSEWQRRITLSVGVPETLESLFAFPFYSWTCDAQQQATQQGGNSNGYGNNSAGGGGVVPTGEINIGNEWSGRLQRAGRFEDDFRKEVERLQFDLNGVWRISSANEDFKLCPSYPPLILVPCCISDDTLQNVANFRGSRRLPAVVWRHKQSGAVIARSSQPEVGWLGWRNSKDEQLLKALADACAFDRGEQNRRQNLCTSGESTPSSAEGSHEEVCMDEVRKILIVDARSYTSAVTNRARGGGCECIEYYPCAEIEFMNLGNIHAIRKSFHALRQLCASPPDVPNWLGLLERTMWLQHLSGLLAASMTVCHAIEKKGRPVLVHCSDGWDRTPQIVATAQLCLDPYYRTVEGFRILVEREWLNFGHKFADRCGHGPGSDEVNERCPVFLQWLDIVHQIHRQFTCSFEFSMAYLIKLAQHSHSCLFGTFLCNSLKERIDNTVMERTFSVWPFLSGSIYKNPLYVPNKEKVLWPAHNVRDLVLWSEVYLGSLGNQNSSDCLSNVSDVNQGSTSPMTKTRSYGDLMTVGGIQNGLIRRSSDPNMIVESHLMMPVNNSDNNSVVDASSERDDAVDGSDTPDIIANIIHDTTEKLQNLTNELNQSDEEICQINNSDDDDNIRKKQQILGLSLPKGEIDNVQQQFEKLENNLNITSTTTAYFNIDSNSSLIKRNEIIIENGSTSTSCDNSSRNKVIQNNHDNIDEDIKRKIEYIDITDGTHQNLIENNHGMLESVDLKDLNSISSSPTVLLNVSLETQNLWHGSINTSTDTLVPIESQQQNDKYNDGGDQEVPIASITEIPNNNSKTTTHNSHSSLIDENINTLNIQKKITSNILPEVHCKAIMNNSQQKQNNAKSTIVTSKLNNLNNINNTNSIMTTMVASSLLSTTTTTTISTATTNTMSMLNTGGNNIGLGDLSNSMDESILILPEHQKLEISSSGKCETITSNSNNFVQNFTIGNTVISSSSSHRRRRTSSSNSRTEQNIFSRNIGGSTTNSRFSTPGIRSLPLTPPGGLSLIERVPVAITCPDGLAHALSEQNIRLQQIVYEHKQREDALLRELHGMRMALLKKTCPHCNNQSLMNDEHNSVLDNMENLSICSWEAVEDRSGPSSGASSTQPPQSQSMMTAQSGSSVLWVPDHAVTRCTGCQTEFWLGRRKHHCRSCGQIFCADCSEYWAPLPDERLYTPVRLCGPCYQNVATANQQQNSTGRSNNSSQIHQSKITEVTTVTTLLPSQPSSALQCSSSSSFSSTNPLFTNNVANVRQHHNHSTSSAVITTKTVASVVTTTSVVASTSASSSISEACKHAANSSRNDCGPLKATAASN